MGFRHLKLIRSFLLAFLLLACSEQPECDDCKVDEFIGEWWQVESDNDLVGMVLGDSCYAFHQWRMIGYEDTGYEDYNYLYGYKPDRDPVKWYVGSWTYDVSSRTFIIEEDYSLTLHDKINDCYDISTDINGIQIDGSACPCALEDFDA